MITLIDFETHSHLCNIYQKGVGLIWLRNPRNKINISFALTEFYG